MFSGIVQEFSKKTEVKPENYGINLSVKVTKKFTKGLKTVYYTHLTLPTISRV